MTNPHLGKQLRQELLHNHKSEIQRYFVEARKHGVPRNSIVFAFDLRDPIARSVVEDFTGQTFDGDGFSRPKDFGSRVSATALVYIAIQKSDLEKMMSVFQRHFQPYILQEYVSEFSYLGTLGTDEFSVVLLAEGGITISFVSLT